MFWRGATERRCAPGDADAIAPERVRREPRARPTPSYRGCEVLLKARQFPHH